MAGVSPLDWFSTRRFSNHRGLSCGRRLSNNDFYLVTIFTLFSKWRDLTLNGCPPPPADCQMIIWRRLAIWLDNNNIHPLPALSYLGHLVAGLYPQTGHPPPPAECPTIAVHPAAIGDCPAIRVDCNNSCCDGRGWLEPTLREIGSSMRILARKNISLNY